jgi:aminoglycoside phosphotransferase family enzyme/adenylate kinase family enzyme
MVAYPDTASDQDNPSSPKTCAMALPPLIRAMSQPSFYPDAPNTVELRQTHISYVFIAGDYVFKVKKPVNFPFVDWSDSGRRYASCADEVRLNTRLSPRIYLGVFAILKDGERFVLGPRVERLHPGAIEYAVKMRRLPDDRMLDRLVASGMVDNQAIRAVARRIADFHAGASTGMAEVHGSARSIERDLGIETAQLEELIGHTLGRSQFAEIDRFCRGFILSHRELLDARVRNGRVRECHGDLRAEHICLSGDGIEIIDCVEFSEHLRYADVASEIAFLAMDLDRLDVPGLADELAASYAAAAKDEQLPLLMPFYKCRRACVRGKVESLRTREPEVPASDRERAARLARMYFALAAAYARAATPALIVVCGLSGTGKSTVARMLQHRTGFEIISSDAARKRLAGIAPGQRINAAYREGIYSESFSRRTYESLASEAETRLTHGWGVILDATFARQADRQAVAAVARRAGASAIFFECVADPEETIARINRRVRAPGEISDATAEVYESQRAAFEPLTEVPPETHVTIDTTHGAERTAADLDNALRRAGAPEQRGPAAS